MSPQFTERDAAEMMGQAVADGALAPRSALDAAWSSMRIALARNIGKSGWVRPAGSPPDHDKAWERMLNEADGIIEDADFRAAIAALQYAVSPTPDPRAMRAPVMPEQEARAKHRADGHSDYFGSCGDPICTEVRRRRMFDPDDAT
jgi:hypothetical protein